MVQNGEKLFLLKQTSNSNSEKKKKESPINVDVQDLKRNKKKKYIGSDRLKT